jgi:hypothetical protein
MTSEVKNGGTHYAFKLSNCNEVCQKPTTKLVIISNNAAHCKPTFRVYATEGKMNLKLALREPLGEIVEHVLPTSLNHIAMAGDDPLEIPLLDHVN